MPVLRKAPHSLAIFSLVPLNPQPLATVREHLHLASSVKLRKLSTASRYMAVLESILASISDQNPATPWPPLNAAAALRCEGCPSRAFNARSRFTSNRRRSCSRIARTTTLPTSLVQPPNRSSQDAPIVTLLSIRGPTGCWLRRRPKQSLQVPACLA